MTVWASDLLRLRAGLADDIATAGVTCMVAGMAVGRLAGVPLALRFSGPVLLGGALSLNLAGFAVFWSSTVAWLSLAGLAAAGLGMAMQYPVNLARAIEASGGRPERAAARAGLGAGVAIGVAPFALGALADAVGVALAFLLVPALLGLVAAVVGAEGLWTRAATTRLATRGG